MASKKTKQNEFGYCHQCGEPLSVENCRETTERSITAHSHLCLSCEQARFDELAELQGRYHALFSQCVAMDVPIIPLALDGIDFNAIDNAWLTYLNILAERGLDKKKGKQLGFADGVKTLWGLFGNKLGEPDLAKRIEAEKKQLANKPKEVGTEQQRERWGTQPIYKGLNFSQELYDELDMLYENRAEGLKGTTITPQIEYTLVTVAKSMAIYNHLLRIGNIQQAQNMWKTIDGMLASENLRKKDEKPVESYRIDTQLVALENAGCMENGKLLPIDKLQEVLFQRFCKGKGKYPHTLDIIDEIIERIWNTMRQNADLAISTDLSKSLRVEDTNGELETEKSAEERQNERDTSVTKIFFVDDDGNRIDEPHTKKQKRGKKNA